MAVHIAQFGGSYAQVFGAGDSAAALTLSDVDALSAKAPYDVSALSSLNAALRGYAASDDTIGKAVECIYVNANTDFQLSYPKEDTDVAAFAQTFIEQIGLRELIRDAVTVTYLEGNFFAYLRKTADGWAVDRFPLGVAEATQWEQNNLPVLAVNMRTLRSRLKKTYLKGKNGKGLVAGLGNEAGDIALNMPDEVRAAYKAGESYAVLDPDNSGVLRFMALGAPYGVSPLAKAVRPRLMLDEMEQADSVNLKVKKKKILAQYLDKAVLGKDARSTGRDVQANAQRDLMRAVANDFVAYTPNAAVSGIEYIETKTEESPVEKIALYRARQLAALGISFTGTEGNWSSSQVSVAQLMRVVNAIAEDFELILNRWFRIAVEGAGLGAEAAPRVKILASELLDAALRKEFAGFLFTTLGCSYETAYRYVDIDIADEAAKRERENASGYEEIFRPRATSYTKSGSDSADGANTDKQAYDRAKQ